MLILTRRVGEKIIIGSNIEITLLSIRGGQVRLGVLAPKETSVHREEIYQKLETPAEAVVFDQESEEK